MRNRFIELDLHDQTLETLCIDFEREVILLHIVVVENVNDEKKYRISFENISNLSMNSIEFRRGGSLEISEVLHSSQDSFYTVKFLLLTGHSEPTFEFSFTYTSLTMGVS